MRLRLCLNSDCQKKLTGKQRMYCSDRCRMVCKRNPNKKFANVRQSFANVREFGNKRTFTIKFSVLFQSDNLLGEWDKGLINKYLRRKLADIALREIQSDYPDWHVEIQIDTKADFD